MPDPRHSSDGITSGEQLDALHAQVVGDDTRDERLIEGFSNARKVKYVADVLEVPAESFDLCADWPLTSWLRSDNFAIARCGLYLAMLKREFFELVMEGLDERAHPELWALHAEAENLVLSFGKRLTLWRTGEPMRDHRVLH
jgi:hypothetical protein